jgi:RNA polymerase sigma-70 factor (ECF subfamily)
MVVGNENADPSGASGHLSFLSEVAVLRQGHPIEPLLSGGRIQPRDHPVGRYTETRARVNVLNVRRLDETPDERLMLLASHGDVAAFDALVSRHRPAVVALARYACGPDLAEEVAQAVFVSLWQHRGKYTPERGSVRSWLLTIARHRGIDLMRSRASRQRLTVVADPHGWMLDMADKTRFAEPPEADIERAESDVKVQRLLSALPPAQRAVIELAYLDDMSQKEIALKLAIPLGTVKGRLRLGLEKLRGPALTAA